MEIEKINYFKKHKKPIIIIAACIVVLITIIFVILNFNKKNKDVSLDESTSEETVECVSNSSPVFTYMITDLSKIAALNPLGSYSGGSPGRNYITIKDGLTVPVYVPMDAMLETIIYAPRGPNIPPEYGFYFKASCEVVFLLDHIDTVSDELKPYAPTEPSPTTRTGDGTQPNEFIKAGTLLGYTDGTSLGKTFDFLVMSSSVEVFHINPDRWEWEQATNAACAYDYYTEDLKEEAYQKIGIVNNEGFRLEGDCGSVSHDVTGTAAGGWFKGDSTDLNGDFLGLGQTSGIIEAVIRKDNNVTFAVKDYTLYHEEKKEPKEIMVGEEICYFDNNNDIWLWLKLETENKLLTSKGNGECPSSFPTTGIEIWDR